MQPFQSISLPKTLWSLKYAESVIASIKWVRTYTGNLIRVSTVWTLEIRSKINYMRMRDPQNTRSNEHALYAWYKVEKSNLKKIAFWCWTMECVECKWLMRRLMLTIAICITIGSPPHIVSLYLHIKNWADRSAILIITTLFKPSWESLFWTGGFTDERLILKQAVLYF